VVHDARRLPVALADASRPTHLGTIGAGLALAFIALTASIVSLGALPVVDEWARALFAPVPHTGLARFVVVAVSISASAQVGVAVLLVLGAAVGLHRNSWRPVLLAGTTACALVVAVFGTKLVVDRVRTPTAVVDPEPAYPSGHATTALVAYGVAVLLLVGSSARVRRWAWGAVALYALLIGIGRVYLGAHWASDVLAGWLLGALILIVVARSVPWVRRAPGTAP
jgi:membrane-associated phospholipid phosphatase